MPGIVQGKEPLLAGLEGKVEHRWPSAWSTGGTPYRKPAFLSNTPSGRTGTETRHRDGDTASTLGVYSRREETDSSSSRRSARRSGEAQEGARASWGHRGVRGSGSEQAAPGTRARLAGSPAPSLSSLWRWQAGARNPRAAAPVGLPSQMIGFRESELSQISSIHRTWECD